MSKEVVQACTELLGYIKRGELEVDSYLNISISDETKVVDIFSLIKKTGINGEVFQKLGGVISFEKMLELRRLGLNTENIHKSALSLMSDLEALEQGGEQSFEKFESLLKDYGFEDSGVYTEEVIEKSVVGCSEDSYKKPILTKVENPKIEDTETYKLYELAKNSDANVIVANIFENIPLKDTSKLLAKAESFKGKVIDIDPVAERSGSFEETGSVGSFIEGSVVSEEYRRPNNFTFSNRLEAEARIAEREKLKASGANDAGVREEYAAKLVLTNPKELTDADIQQTKRGIKYKTFPGLEGLGI